MELSFSVLLSVYKNEQPKFLCDALSSIWGKQELRPSQVVLVKDGPVTEDLDGVIGYWKEKIGDQLVVLELPRNLGLGAALNAGLELCSNDLVARMDTDDISLPARFSKQIAYMEKHPEIAAVSSAIEEWDEEMKNCLAIRRLPLGGSGLVSFARSRSPLNHPASVFRKSVVNSVGGYPELRKAQDYALWALLIQKGYLLANLPDVLLRMRTGESLMARRGWSYFRQEIALLGFQRKIGFINIFQYIFSIVSRGGLRLSPQFLKIVLYKHFR